MEDSIDILNSLSVSNLWEVSRKALGPRDMNGRLDWIVNDYLFYHYSGGIPQRFHTGGNDYHYDTVPRPLRESLCLKSRKGWNELYFQFGVYDGKEEFSIPWGKNRRGKADPVNRKILANYYRDSIDTKLSWYQGLDTALIELATGVRIPKPQPRWPMVQEVMNEIEICELYGPQLPPLKSSLPEKPICKVRIMSWESNPEEVSEISDYPMLVAFQPGLSHSNRFFAVDSVRKLSNRNTYCGFFGSSRIINHNRSAILGKWDKPDVSEAVWVFGIHPSLDGKKISVFSMLVQDQMKEPILLARAARVYDYEYTFKYGFNKKEYSDRIWLHNKAPAFFYGKINHDFLLELTTISLLYGKEKQPFYEIIHQAITQQILPIAFYKDGRLYPVNEDNIRNCQKIILGAMGLR